MVVAVNMGESSAHVRTFVAQHRLNFTQLLDPDNIVASLFSVPATPTNYFIDREGRMLGAGVGYRDWTTPEAHRFIESLLAEGKN